MRTKLQIYITEGCPICEETKRLANDIAHRYPNFVVDLINLDDLATICPENVFAVPTFVCDDRVIFLGNPSISELDAYFRERRDG